MKYFVHICKSYGNSSKIKYLLEDSCHEINGNSIMIQESI